MTSPEPESQRQFDRLGRVRLEQFVIGRRQTVVGRDLRTTSGANACAALRCQDSGRYGVGLEDLVPGLSG